MRKIVTPPTQGLGEKDESGAYILARPTIPDPEVSIDELLKQSLTGLSRAVRHINGEISAGNVSREVIGNLKDVVAMLNELRKKEQEILATMSDEDLEKLITKK